MTNLNDISRYEMKESTQAQQQSKDGWSLQTNLFCNSMTFCRGVRAPAFRLQGRKGLISISIGPLNVCPHIDKEGPIRCKAAPEWVQIGGWVTALNIVRS